MDRKQAIKDFGNFMRTARQSAGITQLALGVELGFKGDDFIGSMERGLRQLPLKHIAKISIALNLSSADIFDQLLRIEELKATQGGSCDHG